MTKAKRWKPKEGGLFYCVMSTGRVTWWEWTGEDFDKDVYRLGNCFKTRSEAQAVARKLKGFWKNVREGR